MRVPSRRWSSVLGSVWGRSALPMALCLAASLPAGETRSSVSANVLFVEGNGRNLDPSGSWLPVYVELETTSRDGDRVVLEGLVEEGKKTIVHVLESVTVSPGAARRAWIYLWAQPSQNAVQRARFAVRGGDGSLIRTGDEWALDSFGGDQARRNVLIVGEGLDATPPWPQGALGSSRDGQDSLPTRALPDSVVGYTGFDVVIVRGLGREPLESAQLEALRWWVYLGGLVVLAPAEDPAALYASELGRMLLGPLRATPKETYGRPNRLWLATAPPEDPRREDRQRSAVKLDAPGAELRIVDPVDTPGKVEIQASFDDTDRGSQRTRVYAELAYGNGHVGVACPVVEGLTRENVEFVREFWKLCFTRVRSGDSRPSLLERAASLTQPGLRETLHDPSRDVGLPFIVALLLGYLLLIGPILYYVLRRRNRLPSVIWVEPLIIVGYVGVIAAVGYVTKGVLTKTREWTILSQVDGERPLLRESYFTVFSGAKQKYRIEAREGLLLQPIFTRESEARTVRLEDRSLVEYELAQWEQAHFVNYEIQEAPVQGVTVTAAPGTSEAPASVTVENHLPYALREGVVRVDSGALLSVPRIDSGQRVVLSGSETLSEAECRDRFEWWPLLSRGELRSGLGAGGFYVLAAGLDRDVLDFQIDRRSILREKRDLYVLYPRR